MNRVGYVIPKENEQPLCNRESIHKNARLVIGCSIIHFEYKFIELLDEAYKSFLFGLHYSTVSLCSMTIERLCYDIIEDSKIIICNRELDYEQKKNLFNIPFVKILDLLRDLRLINRRFNPT